jgi:hypothetical protein
MPARSKIPRASRPSTRDNKEARRRLKESSRPFARDFSSSSKKDGTYTEDQIEFLAAIERYKRENRRPFPAWSEVLAVLVSLGYRKVTPP